jgi:putative spermidine/putrescine transport system permease protein
MKSKITNIIPFTLVFIFAILPLILGIGYALLYSVGLVGVLNNGITSQHWRSAFSSYEVVQSFLYTTGLSLVSIFLCVGAGIFLALFLGKKITKWCRLLFYLFTHGLSLNCCRIFLIPVFE